jgi:hypothetical protein
VDGERLLFDSFKKRILSMELDDEDERRKLKKPRTVRTDVELDARPSSNVGLDGGKEEAVKLPKSRRQVTVDQVQGNKNQDRRQGPRKDLHDAQHSAMRRIPSRVRNGYNEMQGKFSSEDHVHISFTSGNAFAEGSLVLITPAETAESDFYAKISKYNVERKIVKLVYEGSRTEDCDAYVNHVLKVGSTIVCCKGNACAKIEELDAEWHRGQPWAIDNEFLEKVVRWEVTDHMDCAIGEQNGVVWGWLPANESEYFPDEPEEKGGKPGPLWRVKFRSSTIMPCDLDAHELAKALELYRTKDARRAAAAAKGSAAAALSSEEACSGTTTRVVTAAVRTLPKVTGDSRVAKRRGQQPQYSSADIIKHLRSKDKKGFFDNYVDASMAPGYYQVGWYKSTNTDAAAGRRAQILTQPAAGRKAQTYILRGTQR